MPQRSPNLPPRMTSALSPVRRKLQTAASMPTVPEPASTSGSCLVCSSQRSPSCTSRRHSVNDGARWYSIGRAMASSTRSGTGVGPAVSRYSFMARACRLDGGSCSITTGHRDNVDSRHPQYPISMSLAQFSDASFAYPGTEILDGASLLIRPGDRLALLAPNGAGKSTALRLLAATSRRTRATCACSAARASPICASRRSCRARGRCSTRCSSRSPTCRRCTTS